MRLLVIVLVGLFLVGNAYAKEQTAQQKKMSACAKANKGKKGDEYKNAMSECLKQDAAPAAPEDQKQKMSACAKANKGKKGDEYKKAMSDCLSK